MDGTNVGRAESSDRGRNRCQVLHHRLRAARGADRSLGTCGLGDVASYDSQKMGQEFETGEVPRDKGCRRQNSQPTPHRVGKKGGGDGGGTPSCAKGSGGHRTPPHVARPRADPRIPFTPPHPRCQRENLGIIWLVRDVASSWGALYVVTRRRRRGNGPIMAKRESGVCVRWRERGRSGLARMSSAVATGSFALTLLSRPG